MYTRMLKSLLRKHERLIALFTKATASQIDFIEGMSNAICKVYLYANNTLVTFKLRYTLHIFRLLFKQKFVW